MLLARRRVNSMLPMRRRQPGTLLVKLRVSCMLPMRRRQPSATSGNPYITSGTKVLLWHAALLVRLRVSCLLPMRQKQPLPLPPVWRRQTGIKVLLRHAAPAAIVAETTLRIKGDPHIASGIKLLHWLAVIRHCASCLCHQRGETTLTKRHPRITSGIKLLLGPAAQQALRQLPPATCCSSGSAPAASATNAATITCSSGSAPAVLAVKRRRQPTSHGSAPHTPNSSL
ncbi:unnamed protein product [Polarella glacialis]|uniref:Uncharacterized protein n=1 Tax=Polarella glacialis TaxID=89957 RepID=A0A813LVH9_POLGL|nr:unnamed protein product [Polarella glacialis]